MITKTINMNYQVQIGEGEDRKDIAFLNAHIDRVMGGFNISSQILNTEALLENKEYFKEKYLEFENEVKKEAELQGWDMYK